MLEFIENVTENMSGMIREEACSLETNLMMSQFATLDEVFEILKKIEVESEEILPWFVSFRNCHINAVE